MRKQFGVVMVGAALLAGAARADVVPPPLDYEAAFVKSFPMVAGAHQIADWDLYSALVTGDLVGYAARIDPRIAQRQKESAGKGYQIELLEGQLSADVRLGNAFAEQRRRIASTLLFAEGGGSGGSGCQPELVYTEGEFRLLLGYAENDGERLLAALVAPSCEAASPGLHITAGRSARFRCWDEGNRVSCGWRLPDMPIELKRVIESEYPRSIRLRWGWRGLGPVLRVRTDAHGNRLLDSDRIAVTLPANLALQFVDGAGQVRWTAPAAGWSRRTVSPPVR